MSAREIGSTTLQARLTITPDLTATGPTGLDVPLTVSAANASGGTALRPADYDFNITTLTFAIGNGAALDSTTGTVSVVNDARLEGDETANFTIGSLSSTLDGQVSVTDSSHTLTLVDNETGAITFEADKSVGEEIGSTPAIGWRPDGMIGC